MTATRPVHQANAPVLLFAGSTMKLHLTGEQTGGAFCLLESVMPPGHCTPVHVHDDEEEAFLVLEGQLEVTIGTETITVRAGESALAPRGIPHQLRNATGHPVRGIVIATPAGFDAFVQAAGVPASGAAMPPVSPERLATLAAEFGIRIPA